jgi:hypothetical protein
MERLLVSRSDKPDSRPAGTAEMSINTTRVNDLLKPKRQLRNFAQMNDAEHR